MRHLRLKASACCVVALLTACGGGEAERGLDELGTPSFTPADEADPKPETSAPTSGLQGSPQPTTATSGTGGTASDGATTEVSPGATVPLERVDFTDPVGDATPGVGSGTPPPWTDLAGGSLERRADAYRLIVRLGGDAPTRAPGSETMNIASFYDVDGDGSIDYEIWVNLGPDGWGPVWYDDQGNAAPGEDSNVTVEIEGDEVRLVFPGVMLASPDRLRFSIASEYGELTTIGSSFARRDDAPDDDQAVSFPG